MADTLEQINHDISICQRCELRASATQPVPGLGQGNPSIISWGRPRAGTKTKWGCPLSDLQGND
jgi:uracil-DNA glycosylase